MSSTSYSGAVDLLVRTDAERDYQFLAGGGEMGALMRAKNWSETPLGPLDDWPQSLRTAVSICLNCSFPILIWWGPDLVKLYNDAYATILGNKHPQALGQKGRECWPEIWHVIGPMLRRVLEEGTASPADDLLLLLERNGYPEECYFSFSYSPIYGEMGAVGGVFCPVLETTDKVVGARRLETLRQLAALPHAESVENACHSAGEVLGQNGWDVPFALIYLISDDGSQARLISTTTGIKPGDQNSPIEIALYRSGAWPLKAAAVRPLVLDDVAERSLPSGAWSRSPEQVYLAPVLLPGATRATAILVIGLNPHKRLNQSYRSFIDLLTSQVASTLADAIAYQAERKRAEALAEIDRAKTRFFSNVSHEFRTPLTLILGPIEDVLRDDSLSKKQRETVELVYRNTLRLLKLVNTLLDFSRIEADRAQARYEAVDLSAITCELASNFTSACERAGLRLKLDCPALPHPVYVDRDMWEKIVLNLLSNAFKFTFEGEIEVRLWAENGCAHLSVRDTGVGIPAHELPRLFERFHRVEGQLGRTHEGSGIGLALVQELVKLHGGTISAESEEHKGTTFLVTVPVGNDHLPPERLGAAAGGVSATSLRAEAYVGEALRWLPTGLVASEQLGGQEFDDATPVAAVPADSYIVVADDNADMRDYLTRLLQFNSEVLAVPDGQAALHAVRSRKPDLLVTDVMMPGLDGLGLLRAMRADPELRDVPIIMLSARAGEESRIEGLDAGADDYLTKPFSARELIARASAAIEMARVRRQAMLSLRESEERFRALVSASSNVVYRMSGDWTDMQHLEGRNFIADTHGPSHGWLNNYIHPEEQSRVLEAVHDAISKKSSFELEHRVLRVDGTPGWTFSRAIPILNERGEIVEWFGTATDITERKKQEEHQKLLLNELNHRVKNTLATVQSLAMQTLRGPRTLSEARAALEARLMALSKTHDILTQEQWERAGLREIVSEALAAYTGRAGEQRIWTDGPTIYLEPKAALAVSMALHELGTNAAKYGALSSESGRVKVSWERGDMGFRLRWEESGGPPVTVPKKQGFGSRLIGQGLPIDLGGKVALDFRPQGVICVIDGPLSPGQV